MTPGLLKTSKTLFRLYIKQIQDDTGNAKHVESKQNSHNLRMLLKQLIDVIKMNSTIPYFVICLINNKSVISDTININNIKTTDAYM